MLHRCRVADLLHRCRVADLLHRCRVVNLLHRCRVVNLLHRCLFTVVRLLALHDLLHGSLDHARLRHEETVFGVRRNQINSLFLTDPCITYIVRLTSRHVCFSSQDSPNKIKVTCCPRIHAMERHRKKNILEHSRTFEKWFRFPSRTIAHSRKVDDRNISIRIPCITTIDFMGYSTWIPQCSHRCRTDELRPSFAMNNRHVTPSIYFVHG